MNLKRKERMNAGSRFAAAFMLASYVAALAPVPAGAGTSPASGTARGGVTFTERLEKAESMISAGKGGRVELGRVSVEIPEGALKKDTEISITRLTHVEDTGESLCNAIPKAGGYRFLPAGTKFEKKVTVTLPYSAELNAKPQALEDLYTYFYDTEKKSWVRLERLEVDREKCLVRSLTTHFTDMINATLTMPESASPADVNLNSIKNLEAAKPDGHLIKFNPPKASNMGDAGFSFELGVPAGRRGVQPQLSVSYSSAGGNGIMGKGFDVNYGSAITTDTRFGLPDYAHPEKNRYMLDGILLEDTDGRASSYRMRKETSFSRIRRYGAGSGADYWEVTDKGGTKRTYGRAEFSCVGGDGRTFTWNLTKVEDVHGNTVVYEYEKDKDGGYVYPSAIYYTGSSGKKGNYRVSFHYDEGGTKREDVRIDGRSREMVACARLLTSITTHYKDGDAIRTYSFSYTEGPAKEKMLTSLKVSNNAKKVSNNAGESYEYGFGYTELEMDLNKKPIYFASPKKWQNGRPLQTGGSTSLGGNLNAGAGSGIGSEVWDVRLTGGGSGSVTDGSSYTDYTFTDIDGDGRTDSIMQDGDTLKVCLNTGAGFGSEEKIQIKKGSFSGEIDQENSSSSSYGWNLYAGGGGKSEKVKLSGGAGYSKVHQDSTSRLRCMFIDMDRDGLVDIVESGKNTYLKNLGNLVFEERPVYSSITVSDVIQKIDGTKAEEYRKAYFVQTPFRMWKAPYEGVTTIRETARAADKSYSPEKNTVIKTFIGDNDSDRELEREISNGGTVTASKKNFEIKKDTDIFFISDSGKEPLNSDIEWGIDINYSKVKPFRKNYPVPLFNRAKLVKKYSVKGNLKNAEKEFAEKVLGSEELLKLYHSEVKSSEEESPSESEVIFSYNSEWKKDMPAEQVSFIYGLLAANGYIYPAVLTKNQFDEYVGQLKNPEGSEKDKEFYEGFAAHFMHSVTQDLYLMKDFASDDDVMDFFGKYPMPGELALRAFENYRTNGCAINLENDGEELSYDAVSRMADDGGRRSEKNAGTVLKLKDNGHKAIVLGTLNDSPLLYDFTDSKLLALREGKISETGFPYDIRKEDDNLSIAINSDAAGTAESLITVYPGKISYKPKNLSDSEMQEIINDFSVPYTNPRDAHWVLTEQKYFKENEIKNLFDTMHLTDAQKDGVISSLYQKKDHYKKVNKDGSVTEVFDYSYYVLKDKPDYEKAGKILDEYKAEKVLTELFPFYRRSGNEYVLDESRNFTETEEKTLEKECSKFFFGKTTGLKIAQHFENEHLYTLDSNGEYSYVTLGEGASLSTAKTRLPKISWNSSEDFKSKESLDSVNVRYEKSICKYDEKVDEAGTETCSADVLIDNDEFLYGGKNNWFFGFWKGALDDVPFSGKEIKSFKVTYEKEAAENKQRELENEQKKLENNKDSLTNEDRNSVKNQMNFYLPEKNADVAKSYGLATIGDDSVSYSVDYARTLLGSVSVCSETVGRGNKRTVQNKYYMPFLSGDLIHARRSGGISYYKIEGLYNAASSGSDTFVIPSLRRSVTTGDDITPSASVDASLSRQMNPEELTDKLKECFAEVAGEAAEKTNSFTGSFSKGWNNSTSSVSQSFQDIDGDGIPDILQVGDGGITVIKGMLGGGAVRYDSKESFTGSDTISENETDVDVFGGSVSVLGNVSIKKTGNNGESVCVAQNPSPSPSSGITYTKGMNTQTKGLVDLNGDGLPDFYDKEILKLSNGSSFSELAGAFKDFSTVSKSSNSSIGANFSIGKNLGGQKVNSLESGASLSGGGSYSASSSNTEKMLLDVNGDGLADKIEMKPGNTSIEVSFNTGKGFSRGENIHLPSWGDLVKDNLLKFNDVDDGSGLDIKPLGKLPLIGEHAKEIFSSTAKNPYGFSAKTYADSLEWNTGITLGLSGSLGANFNIPIPVPLAWGLKLNVTCNYGEGLNASMTANGISVRMTDLDGDGLADHVLRIPGEGLYWKRNLMGRAGRINRITLPQGGSVTLEYEEKYGTRENPNFKYVLSAVTMDDGTGKDGTLPALEHGSHSVSTRYEYDGGYYDRAERDFYGFASVKTVQADGTYQLDEYYNREYYSKGILKESNSFSADRVQLSKSKTVLMEAPYALPKSESSCSYEKSSGTYNYIQTSTEYEYDGYGNCTKVVQDFGGGVTLTGEVDYDNSNEADYIIALPLEIRVYGSDGTLLRRRSGSYDRYGSLTELRQYYDDYGFSTGTLTYDEYGNIESVTDSRGAKLSYTYDEFENMFVTDVLQGGSGTDTYSSAFEYDAETQTKKRETDSNGNFLRYEHDHWQRVTEIFTAYDGTAPAVSYEYHTPGAGADGKHGLWYAVTGNKVSFDSSDASVIQTVVQVDGLGRAVRTAKTGFVGGKSGWNASGAVEYDSKGRTVKEGMTEFIPGSMDELLASVPGMTALFTLYAYDEKDRQIMTKLPDGSVQTNAFYIEENRLVSESRDPLGNVSVQETDSRGNVVRVLRKDKAGSQLTEVTYEYNEMGEMLRAFDAEKHPVSVEYDLLGRKTALESLDSGRQEFFYDDCSNLVRENNSVLRESGRQILYEYDGLNRLVRIDYPDTEDTLYVYGGAGDSHGAAGKILSVTDASGSLSYEYGSLGEVTKETRTILTHLNGRNDSETSVMEYRSDYLGRMQWILYPDGEKVTYGYDAGGQVVSVTGEHYGKTFEYVTNILYDEYGQRTRIDYGNGTFTEYSYDAARRWLDTVKTQNKWGQSFQNIKYSFDFVGNVSVYENDCMDAVRGNYKTRQKYEYDNLYQLVKVEGSTTYDPYRSSVPEFVSGYSQTFAFDTAGLGNMVSKVSSETVTPKKTVGDDLNYSFKYVYDENYAHRLVSAGDRHYKYDSNGNVICEQDGGFDGAEPETYHKITQEDEDVYSTDYAWGYYRDGSKKGMRESKRYRRVYTWNERNLLISSVDSTYSTAYVYGQDGQRSNKYTQNSETLYFNKMWTLHTDSGNNIYGGQSAKNIYLGETRIVTKLNSGANPTYQEEYYKQYYYHSDHLGSASLISDYKGDEYQRIEYTPYGETWVEKTQNVGLEYLPYKFTSKELDEETGLYYYGARYLDPKYSMWISTDPALGDYIPVAPTNDEAKQHNSKLPGMGGVFNHINLNLYHYAGNNPIKYTDPDGRTNYVFYDPESFSAQANAEAARMPVEQEKIVKEELNHYKYATFIPEETVLIPVTTEKAFVEAWNKMENPTDVTLIFHGSAHTLNIDYRTNEYLSTSPDGKTPLGNPGTYIGSLKSKTIGTLKIYSCQGGNVKESDNVAQCFKKNNTIGKLFASDGSLSFTRGKYEPKKSREGRAEYKKKYNQEPQGLVEVK